MGRVIVALLFLALIALIFYVFYLAYLGYKSRQRKHEVTALVRIAPALLRERGVPGPVVDMLLEQGNLLEEARRIFEDATDDPAVLIPSEYALPMDAWLTRYNNARKAGVSK